MLKAVSPIYIKVVIGIFVAILLIMVGSLIEDYRNLGAEASAGAIAHFLLSYIIAYKYLMLFLVIFSAGMILPIPVSVILMAVGAFSEKGVFDFWISLGVASTANSVGSYAAYLFFDKYGHKILRDQFVEKYSFFLSVEEYFKSRTYFSIFMSRIFGLFETPVNFLAGYMHTPQVPFLFLNFTGNIAYTWIYLYLGVIVGDRWVNFSNVVNGFISILTLVALFLILRIIYKNYLQKLIPSA